MQYTVIKPFVFRGVSYVSGDLFDTDESLCDPHRAKTLMHQRYLTPGYSEQKAASAGQKAKKQANAKAPANDPQKGDSEPDDTNEPEQPENEPEQHDGEEHDAEDGDNSDEEPEEPAPAPVAKTTSRRRS